MQRFEISKRLHASHQYKITASGGDKQINQSCVKLEDFLIASDYSIRPFKNYFWPFKLVSDLIIT